MRSSEGTLKGRTYVITGATSGIGRATAVALSATGADLALIARRVDVGIKLASELRSQPGAGQVDFYDADLSDQTQVRAVASEVAAKHEKIDALINNAGAKFDTYQQSCDGIELTFATNYLGHFLLAGLLTEPLLKAKGARVITLGSGAHRGISAERDWCLGPDNYNRKLAYGKSKLADIMFTYELARRLNGTGVVSNAVDPGGVATNLGRNNGLISWCRHLLYHALKRELISARRGAETVVFLAADQAVQGVTGKYFYQKRQIDSSPQSYDMQAARRLWSLSCGLAHVDDSQTAAVPMVKVAASPD